MPSLSNFPYLEKINAPVDEEEEENPFKRQKHAGKKSTKKKDRVE